MRMLKRLGSILALAFAVCGFSVAHAAERAIDYVVVAMAHDFPDGAAKLSADLAYQAHAKVMYASHVNADLDRDGHGFRQHSAMELALASTAPNPAA